MSKTVGDQILERLHAWGVRRVFGYPGDGINGVVTAFAQMRGQMEFVQARHEELAAFMARLDRAAEAAEARQCFDVEPQAIQLAGRGRRERERVVVAILIAAIDRVMKRVGS